MELLLSLDEFLFEQTMLYLNPRWLLVFAEFFVRPEKYFFVFLLFVFFALKRNFGETLFVLAIILFLLLLNDTLISILKKIFSRPRPGLAMGIYWQIGAYSFPSAHSANSMVLAIFLERYFFHRGVTSLFSFLALFYSLLLGIFRLIANYHYPLDVVCGWLLGFLLGRLYFKIFWLNLSMIKRM